MTGAHPPQIKITAFHRRRLRDVWRSAGWPCQDMVEVELLAAGLLSRHVDIQGRDALRLTDDGIALLAATLQRNRSARQAHEDLVEQVAACMQRAGRIVWRGLSLRAALQSMPAMAGPAPAPTVAPSASPAVALGPPVWTIAMPDVYSIRNTSVEDYVEPIVHEVKVSRADLLGDLRNPDKRAAYLAMSGECWYVLKAGIGTAADVPETCGVLIAEGASLEVARPAPRRPARLGFATWMVLAKAAPCGPLNLDNQGLL